MSEWETEAPAIRTSRQEGQLPASRIRSFSWEDTGRALLARVRDPDSLGGEMTMRGPQPCPAATQVMRYESVNIKESAGLDPAALNPANPREKWLRKRTQVKLRVCA